MKQHHEYFIGLDIGTNSVGWAVTGTDYKLKRFNKKHMHGVRMFEAMETSANRRAFRSSRRRLRRRKNRLQLLRTYFEKEIQKIDSNFFTRIEEGFLQSEERTVKRFHTLFDDDKITDKDFYKRFPTIYHLRHYLMHSNEKNDIRLIYLAIHHIMKYRGHFLFPGELNLEGNIADLLNDLNYLSENIFNKKIYEFSNENNVKEFLKVLTRTDINKMRKTKELKMFVTTEIDSNEKHFDEIHKLLAARKCNLSKLFVHNEFENPISIQFDDVNIEEELLNLTALDNESLMFVNTLKGIYDWGILQNTLQGEASISKAMIESYEKHRRELKELKKIIKIANSDKYSDFFHNESNKQGYANYVKKGVSSREDFYKGVKAILENASDDFKNEVEHINLLITNKDYLLKQRIPTNGIIPYQLHLFELKKILEKASKFYDFLNIVDETKLSIKQQISEIFKFRIPYYIGPLNDYHKEDGFAWVVRKERGKVLPWNFEEKIDVEKTTEVFIRRMTNKCTYLLKEDVLPKSSLLYQKFMVLNTINNIKINGKEIKVEQKQKLFEDLFEKRNRNISKKEISVWIKNNYSEYSSIDIEITGIDDAIKSKLTSQHEFKKIFGNNLPDTKVLENIVLWSTLFADEKAMLVQKIKNEYTDLFTASEIEKMKNLVFTGWGRISQKMLEGLLDYTNSNEPRSIIQTLFETNSNLMQLLSSQFSYHEQIREINNIEISNSQKIEYEDLSKLNLPPNIRRSVWQTIKITNEIQKVTKQDPKRIFIEMARGREGTGRTISRKQQLKAFYKSFNKDNSLIQGLSSHLENETDENLRIRKVYLYYKQLGRCMYTNEIIHFKDLMDKTIYDIDHIYPRSITADDSMSNLVLVTKKSNVLKGNSYPINESWQKQMSDFWNQLHKIGLIESEKYFRLTRKDSLTLDELSNFVARQLVETRQSSKAIYHLMKRIYPNTEIISVQSRHIDRFRHDNGFIKVRSLNDLHHAKDAYLAIVVGNVYFEKFTNDPRNFIKKEKARHYNLIKLLDTKNENNDVFSSITGELVFESGEQGTIEIVRKAMNNNAVLTTYMVQEKAGELFNQTIIPKAKNKVPIKKGLPTIRYGGYNKATYAYYSLIEHDMGKRRVRSLAPIFLYLKNQIKTKSELIEFLEKEYKYKNIKIIKPYLPSTNILLEYDGGRHRITGVTGNSFVMRNETQPFFEDRFIKIWKMIENIKINKKEYLIEKIEIIDLEYVYDEINKKMNLGPYKIRLKNFQILVEEFQENIKQLSNKDLIDLLWELIKLLKSTRESSNLKIIGGFYSSGINILGRNLSNKKSVKLIHQSITGLYEQKEDLLNL